jgi:hypothetical protein
MYLIAPFSWEHHLVFVLPAVVLALLQVSCGERKHVEGLWRGFSSLPYSMESTFYRAIPKARTTPACYLRKVLYGVRFMDLFCVYIDATHDVYD